jgi:CRP-like cAMP-binding protein
MLGRRTDRIDALRSVPLLGALSRKHRALIAKHADEVNVKPGKVLAEQGRRAQDCLLILNGSARVDRDGKTIARVGPGDVVGEMAVIDGQPRSATVTALTPMVLLVVPSRSFNTLLDEVPQLRRKVLVALCERLRALDEQLAARN